MSDVLLYFEIDINLNRRSSVCNRQKKEGDIEFGIWIPVLEIICRWSRYIKIVKGDRELLDESREWNTGKCIYVLP